MHLHLPLAPQLSTCGANGASGQTVHSKVVEIFIPHHKSPTRLATKKLLAERPASITFRMADEISANLHNHAVMNLIRSHPSPDQNIRSKKIHSMKSVRKYSAARLATKNLLAEIPASRTIARAKKNAVCPAPEHRTNCITIYSETRSLMPFKTPSPEPVPYQR